MTKKLLCSLCLLVCCFTVLGVHSKAADTPTLASEAACVMDADTGEILFQKHAGRSLRPASITKQMTALLVLEHVATGDGSLDDKVKVTSEALSTVNLDSTRIGFEVGQKRTVRDLMYCMLVYSANDAANILAEYVGGDVSTFVDRMNDRAKELGCTNTHFSNPNGLDPDDGSDHHTCARDMARISLALEAVPDYFTFAGSMKYNLDTDKVIPEPWEIWTKVDMLRTDSEYYNEEVTAGKTGWTSKAHHTFVVYMTRGDRNLIIVTMNSIAPGDKYEDSVKLMDYCCDSFQELTLTPDNYQNAAERSIQQSGLAIKLDASNLPELSILLPNGMSADNLRYKVSELNDDCAELTIGIAEDSWETYQAATHIQGDQARLLTVAVPLKTSLASELFSDGTPSGSGSGSAAGPGFSGTSAQTRILLTIVAAVLVLFSILFLIMRSVHRRKAAKQAAEHKPLQIVI
ncbi:MAG: D-alanyl-D-alanine carboxypeptidase family protein, partial [Butyricicoccus sp.]